MTESANLILVCLVIYLLYCQYRTERINYGLSNSLTQWEDEGDAANRVLQGRLSTARRYSGMAPVSAAKETMVGDVKVWASFTRDTVDTQIVREQWIVLSFDDIEIRVPRRHMLDLSIAVKSACSYIEKRESDLWQNS